MILLCSVIVVPASAEGLAGNSSAAGDYRAAIYTYNYYYQSLYGGSGNITTSDYRYRDVTVPNGKKVGLYDWSSKQIGSNMFGIIEAKTRTHYFY